MQNYTAAVADFGRAIKLAPDIYNYMLRAQAREGAGDYDRALGDYREAARLDPKSIAAVTAQGGVWRIAACTGLLNSGRLHGKPEGVAYALRGLAYLDRGDIPHAIGDLDQAVKLAPDFAPRRSPTTTPPSMLAQIELAASATQEGRVGQGDRGL